MNTQTPPDEWPKLDFDPLDEPHFIFLLTPANSGSTAIAKIFHTLHTVGSLRQNGEGQWLIPGLCAGDRWNPKKFIDYSSIRSVWLSRYQELKRDQVSINTIFEKSPPNMLRIRELQTLFANTSILINNRNPYAVCSSRFHRYISDSEREGYKPKERAKSLQNICSKWVSESSILKAIAEEQGAPVLTYEKFLAKPILMQNIVRTFKGCEKTSLDFGSKIEVKDYQPQGLKNFNQEQIAKLSADDMSAISAVLEREKTLLDYFGYECL